MSAYFLLISSAQDFRKHMTNMRKMVGQFTMVTLCTDLGGIYKVPISKLN